MGDFTRVTMGAGILKINDVDVGFLKKEVKVTFKTETKEFIPPVIPKRVAGLFVLSQSFELQPAMAEISGDNMKYALGGIEPVVSSGSLVDKTASFESLTFAVSAGSPGIQRVKLGASAARVMPVTISGSEDAPVVKSSDELTTYVENTDYIVDYTTGWVYRNPGGSIGSGATVKVKYKYTPVAGKRIDLGKGYSQLTFKLEFIHTNPNTQKKIQVVMWKAAVKPEFDFSFGDSEELALTPTFTATDDSDINPDNPYGYIYIQE